MVGAMAIAMAIVHPSIFAEYVREVRVYLDLLNGVAFAMLY